MVYLSVDRFPPGGNGMPKKMIFFPYYFPRLVNANDSTFRAPCDVHVSPKLTIEQPFLLSPAENSTAISAE